MGTSEIKDAKITPDKLYPISTILGKGDKVNLVANRSTNVLQQQGSDSLNKNVGNERFFMPAQVQGQYITMLIYTGSKTLPF